MDSPAGEFFFFRNAKYWRMQIRRKEMFQKIALWLKAVRAPFFSASAMSVLVGNAAAYFEGEFNWFRFWLILGGVTAFHAGGNLINDYYDYRSGCDGINSEYTTFNGGSRLLPSGLIKPEKCRIAAFLCFGAGLAAAAYLHFLTGYWGIPVFTALGLGAAYFYSSPGTNLMSRGGGEILIWTAFGPALVCGAYFTQAGRLSWTAFLSGIPLGFLVMGILFLNEFPDVVADMQTGKRNWVVSLGRNKKAVLGFMLILALAYFSIYLSLISGNLPREVSLVWLTLPLAFWVCARAWRFHKITAKLLPAMAGNIGLHFLVGLLMVIGLVAGRG